jgi:hypothetical protein
MPLLKEDIELIKIIGLLNHPQKMRLKAFAEEILYAEENTRRQTIGEYNLELDQAIERVKKGEYTSIEDLEKEMESW